MDKIDQILKEYRMGLKKLLGKNLKQVILYGSYARGEQELNHEISDIDIMILVDNISKDIENNVIEYSYELNLKYNILLSPIIENIKDYKTRSNYIPFYKNVKNQGVLLNG